MLSTVIAAAHILLSVAAGFVSAYDCGITPIVLPNQNGTLYAGVTVNRGINFQCFPSAQRIALRPSFIWNNTRVRNSINCKGNSSEIVACQGASGSTFVWTPDF